MALKFFCFLDGNTLLNPTAVPIPINMTPTTQIHDFLRYSAVGPSTKSDIIQMHALALTSLLIFLYCAAYANRKLVKV